MVEQMATNSAKMVKNQDQNEIDPKSLEEWLKQLRKDPNKPGPKPFKERANAGLWAFKPQEQSSSRVVNVATDQFVKQVSAPQCMLGNQALCRGQCRATLWRTRASKCQNKPNGGLGSSAKSRPHQPFPWEHVQQVYHYIKSLPGAVKVAEEFCSQEINGTALLLITEDHLVQTMNLRLGPALKICSHINKLKTLTAYNLMDRAIIV